MKIGIYLAYAERSMLPGEGLGQYARQILLALAKRDDITVVVACPTWLKTELREFLSDGGPIERVEFFTVGRQMLAFKLIGGVDWLRNLLAGTGPRRPSKITEAFRAALYRIIIAIAGLTNPLVQTGLLLLTILFAPLIAIFMTIVWVTVHLLKFIGRMIALRIRAFVEKKQTSETHKSIFGLARLIFERMFRFLGKTTFFEIRQEIALIERRRLIDAINRSRDVDVWLVPAAFWSEVDKLAAPYVLTLPDLVPRILPVNFAELDLTHSSILKEIDARVAAAAKIITFSRTVAHEYEAEYLGGRITIIPHGTDRLDRHIRVMGQPLKSFAVAKFANELVTGFRNVRLQQSEYLRTFDFDSVQYLFYAAQARPHKNILNLVKAYEKALREGHFYQKLILTGDLTMLPDTWNYVRENRLQYDVIMMSRVSDPVLAALYYKATLAICPSLFEGGFPFTFTEAMSVGTPTLLALNRVVVETLQQEPELLSTITFDPFDVDGVAEKMIWAVSHRDELLRLEMPLYDRLAKRSWDVAAEEYLRLFRSLAERKNNDAKSRLVS